MKESKDNLRKKHIRKSNIFEKIMQFLKQLEPLFRLVEVVFVVFGTVFVSLKANNIAEMQLNITKADLQPQFSVQEIICENKDGEKNANAVLNISKESGDCNNINIDCICFIEYTYFEDYMPISVNVGLSSYFFWQDWSEQNDGNICIFMAENNWKKYREFAIDILNSDNVGDGFVELKKYVKISYEDELREPHTNYYRVDGAKGELLNSTEGSDIFKEYYFNDKSIHIYDLCIENFMNIIKK